ncbi:hypothetical protein ACJW30_03G155600 [Castanea mollissima]
MTGGMSDFIFVTYSNAIAIFFLLSSCLIFYRKRSLPPLTWGIVGGVFLVALLSVVGAAIIIVLGFYAVIWGQAQEEVVVEHHPITSSYESSSPNAPLLQNEGTEV